MNRFSTIILIAIVVLAMACSHKKKASPDPFGLTENPIDAMRLPPDSDRANPKNKNKRDPRTIEIRAGDTGPDKTLKPS
jgi:hypothetical protein